MTDRERNHNWYLKNREELLVRRRAYYYAHRDHIIEQQRQNRSKNKRPYVLLKLVRCLGITHAEARQILGLPPVRKYIRHD